MATTRGEGDAASPWVASKQPSPTEATATRSPRIAHFARCVMS